MKKSFFADPSTNTVWTHWSGDPYLTPYRLPSVESFKLEVRGLLEEGYEFMGEMSEN